VLIQEGDRYLWKNNMTEVQIEEILVPYSQFKVRRAGGRSVKVALQDLLLQPTLIGFQEEEIRLPDLSRFGLILSLSSQTMRETNGHVSPMIDRWFTDKEFLTRNIQKSGGKVLTNLMEHYSGRSRVTTAPQQLLLLTHKPLRTKKFLLSLAYGIPIISVFWLRDCFDKNTVLDYEPYRLCNGESLLLQQFIAAYPKVEGVFHSKVFFGMKM
jgi:hypothetical protein